MPAHADRARSGARSGARRWWLVGLLTATWLAVAVPVGVLVFLGSTRTTVLASHEARVSPALSGWAEISLGPVLPSFRYPTGVPLGATIELGKTSSTSFGDLTQRYALLAAQPEGQIAKVEGALVEMALAAAGTGALAGAGIPALWILLGHRRRVELLASRRAWLAAAVSVPLWLAGVSLVALRPWDDAADRFAASAWEPLDEALPDVPIPVQARRAEVDASLLTQGTQRLLRSTLDSYRKGSAFYRFAAQDAERLGPQLRQPADDETVAVLVSDRHDNIGMDAVARAIGDAGGATLLLNAGDDTSTGSSWEAFSLESLWQAFEGYDAHLHVAGNHDHGSFIPDQADDLGFTRLNGEFVEGPEGIRFLGVDDPRSSGLGNWRQETGLSFGEVRQRLADSACSRPEDERVTTMLVHDVNLGKEALRRGCVDLVLGGHVHVVQGPTAVIGENGRVGYAFTNGTTGGAAYAIAVGSKPRREATVSLVTYRQGRPVGVQTVQLSTLGDYRVGPWASLTYGADGPPVDPPG